LGKLIYIQNITDADIISLLKGKTDFEIIVANPMLSQNNSLEEQIKSFNHLTFLFEANKKSNRNTIIIQNISSNLSFKDKLHIMANNLPDDQRPDVMIVISPKQNNSFKTTFKQIPLASFIHLRNINNIWVILKKSPLSPLYIPRRRKTYLISMTALLSIAFLLLILYNQNKYPLITSLYYDDSKTIKNTKIQLIHQVILQNNDSKPNIIKVLPNNNMPIILNYTTTSFSKSTFTDNDHAINTYHNKELRIMPHTRMNIFYSYNFTVADVINKTDLSIGEPKEIGKTTNNAKPLVNINDDIAKKAQSITDTCRDNNEKFLEIYKFVLQNMHYSFDYKYAHMGSISSLSSNKGVCEDFASLFVALSQSVGLPSRYDRGISIKPTMITEEFMSINTFHAWPDVFFKKSGWIPIEVTIDDNRIRNYLNDNVFCRKLMSDNNCLYLSIVEDESTIIVPSSVDKTDIWLIRKVH